MIGKLVHLSSGTDLATAHLIPAANSVGYGYITTVSGDVFFDFAALKNARFDQLARGMLVEYELDQAPYLRSSAVVVVAGLDHEP